jgi:hypothetical protein
MSTWSNAVPREMKKACQDRETRKHLIDGLAHLAADWHGAERNVTCTDAASCEDGDHSYTWPCDFAPGTGRHA